MLLTPSKPVFLLLYFCSLSFLPLFSQFRAGDKMLAEKDYGAAEKAYRAGLSDEEEAARCLFGLARVFADSNYARFQLDSAYDYANQSLEAYRKLDYKLRKKVQKHFNSNEINTLKREVEERAFFHAQRQNTIAAYESYMERYGKAKYKLRRDAEQERNRLAYELAREENTVDAFSRLLRQYGASMKEKTPVVYKWAQMGHFEAYILEYSWAAYDTFARLFPDNAYVQDSLKSAFDELRGSADWQAFKRFARAHGSRPFALLARDSLAALLLGGDNLREQKAFLDAYPEHGGNRELWRRYYETFKKKNGTAHGLKRFQREHPEFPFPELLEPDIRRAIDNEASEILAGEDYERSREFIETYPHHERAHEVWRHFYRLYLRRDNSLESIRHFESIYPAFPFPQLFEESIRQAVRRNYERVMADEDMSRCLYFIRSFPDFEQLDSVWWKYFGLFRSQRPALADIRQFGQDHPSFPYPDSLAALIREVEARQEAYEFESLCASCSLAKAHAFLKSYPESRFLPELEQYLYALVKDLNDEESYRFFLQRFPDNPHREEIALQLLALLDAGGSLEGLDEWEKNFPRLVDEGRMRQSKGIARKAREIGISDFSESRRADFTAFIRGAAPHPLAFQALWNMVKHHLEYEEWEEVANAVNAFQPYFENNNPRFNQLLALAHSGPAHLEVRSLGDAVNSRAQEFEPIVSADGKLLYFTGRGRADNLGGEDIFVAEWKDGRWQNVRLAPVLSSRSDNESAESISADGRSMILFRSGRLSYSEWQDSAWSAPRALPSAINCNSWQADGRLAADGKALLFASRKENGDTDLYASLRQPDGSWGKPINLGPSINTPHTDRSPFLHPDMKTLYFSSEGHIGMGKLDVFRAVRLDSSWANWSEPVNLGRAINTKDHNWGYRISTDGQLAYYSAANGRNLDLYEIGLPGGLQPEQVSTVAGTALSQNGKPLDAEITWRHLDTQKEAQRVKANAATGGFFLTLPKRIRYSYTAKKDGYFPQQDTIDLTEGHRDINLYLVLTSLEEMKSEDKALPIKNLFFETARYEIKPASFPALDELAEVVKEQGLSVEIHGHTDNVGSVEDNLLLSRKRAEAVRSYLLKQGCEGDKVAAEGFGESRPVETNDSREGQAQNRRVEIRVVK